FCLRTRDFSKKVFLESQNYVLLVFFISLYSVLFLRDCPGRTCNLRNRVCKLAGSRGSFPHHRPSRLHCLRQPLITMVFLDAALSFRLSSGITRAGAFACVIVLLCVGIGGVQSRRVRETAVARCIFRTGDAVRDASLTPFYVPLSDAQMYEEGIKEYLSHVGSQAEQFSVVCVGTQEKEVKCELCLYNEVSEDRKHVRQGQVLDAMLLQCIEGKFSQGSAMTNSQYHPICYPPAQNRVPQSGETRQGSVTPHQQLGEGRGDADKDSCGRGPGGF
ncbi:transmembrane protein, partial [Cystoisospora suis]